MFLLCCFIESFYRKVECDSLLGIKGIYRVPRKSRGHGFPYVSTVFFFDKNSKYEMNGII